jgi:predicted ribosomally synthesized peptide with nif11-like leader
MDIKRMMFKIERYKNDVQNNTMIGRTLSMAGLKEFLEKLRSDTELQEKVEAAVDENAILKVITDAGYDVKQEDIEKFLEDTVTELSDSDLDNVAGGVSLEEIIQYTKKIILAWRRGASASHVEGMIEVGQKKGIIDEDLLKMFKVPYKVDANGN